MTTRRTFLRAVTGTALAAQALSPEKMFADLVHRASVSQSDEDFWGLIQNSFDIDRSMINLNNGGVCPSPRVVQEALRRYTEYTNLAPTRNLWTDLEPRVETVREELARFWGVSNEEIAVTRNASESLEIVQLGLNLKSGDEVLTTTHDYPRMLTTWEQRGRRDGVVLKKVSVPVPLIDPKVIVERIEAAITPKTRVIHVSEVIFLSGQYMPVKEICALAEKRGIVSIVDGAHAFAHFNKKHKDIGCDFYGVSLHKWLLSPIGTGLLFARKEKIKDVWSLFASSQEQESNIRKFEEIGTHPAANHNAITHALGFTQMIGMERKEARLRSLSARWYNRLKKYDNVEFQTDIEHDSSHAGLVLVGIKSIDPGKLHTHLWEKHRVWTTAIVHPECSGIRVSPNVYTTLNEVDLFADVMEDIASGKVVVK